MANSTSLAVHLSQVEEKKYTYEPLKAGTDSVEFRILELLPATDFESTIRCRLHHMFLGNHTAYCAISYCWGKAANTGRISVCNSSISVGENLENALRHLRKSDQSRMLWADAICINQGDVDERNRQVRLMRRIFRSSTMTLVWLGDGQGMTDGCLEIVSKVLKLEKIPEASPCCRQRDGADPGSQGALLAIFNDPAFHDFWRLRYSECFERIWVVQELAVAPAVKVCLGNQSVEWSSFYSAMIVADLHFKTSLAPGNHVWPMQHAREQFSTQKDWRLLDMLMAYRNLEATDPRDKVIALLGLLHDTRYDLQQDYTRHPSEIYTDTALMMMKVDQHLDFFAVPRVTTSKFYPDLELPSWVPDWRSPGDRPAMRIRYGSTTLLTTFGNGAYRFCASGDRIISPPTSLDRLYLGVDGLSLGCICSLSNTWVVYGAFTSTRFHLLDILAMGTKRVEQLEQWMAASCLHLANKDPLLQSPFVSFWETTIMAEYEDVLSILENDSSYKRRLGAYHQHFRRLRRATRAHTWSTLVKATRCALFNMRLVPFVSTLVTFVVRAILGISKNTSEFEENLNTTCFGRCMMRTDTDHIGLVPENSEIGDHIFIVQGSTVPLVLRSRGDKWELIGGAYVHGGMYGEFWEASMSSRIWLI